MKTHSTAKVTQKTSSTGEVTSNESLMDVLRKPLRATHQFTNASLHQDDNQSITGTVIGEIMGFENSNGITEVFVTYPGSPYRTPLLALTTVDVTKNDLGKHAALSFDQGNPSRPIIMGIIKNTHKVSELELDRQNDEVTATLDGDRVKLSAENEIVLKCGKSSITLTKAGKIILRGEYIVSRSTGVNSIKGGSVKIN